MLVEVEAIGVAGVDTKIRSGALAAYGFTEGHIPGSEVAGTVAAVGAKVPDSWLGRRVWAFTGLGGGYADYAVASLEGVVPLPEGLSADGAVTLGSSGVVAHFGLAHARFTAGDSVLVRGAAGSIGILAVHLASRGGASDVAVTTSSPERGARLLELGATQVLDRSGRGTSQGYDVIFDVVAGAELPAFLDRLKPNGRLVTVGIVGGPPPADFGTAMIAAFRKSLTFATFSADTVPATDRHAVRTIQFEAASRGQLPLVVHETLALSQAVEAHQKMDAGEVFGRIVLKP